MATTDFTMPERFMERYRAYLNSVDYSCTNDYSKSKYWKYNSNAIKHRIKNHTIQLYGQAGLGIPKKTTLSEKKNRVSKLKQGVKAIYRAFLKETSSETNNIKLMNYADAFDAVMMGKKISIPIISPYRIDFSRMLKLNSIVPSMERMRKTFFAKDRYRLQAAMIRCYYFRNLLNAYIPLDKLGTIMEIGPGTGNFAALLHHSLQSSQMLIVDLPESLSVSMVFLSDLFPDAKIVMPNEAEGIDWTEADFVFLSPKQIHLIKDNSVDLAINTASFQEMTTIQIQAYFELIQRCSRSGGWFFCSNRVEKIPVDGCMNGTDSPELPIRFSEYPWRTENETLFYEICRLSRLVQLDNLFVRLDRIVK